MLNNCWAHDLYHLRCPVGIEAVNEFECPSSSDMHLLQPKWVRIQGEAVWLTCESKPLYCFEEDKVEAPDPVCSEGGRPSRSVRRGASVGLRKGLNNCGSSDIYRYDAELSHTDIELSNQASSSVIPSWPLLLNYTFDSSGDTETDKMITLNTMSPLFFKQYDLARDAYLRSTSMSLMFEQPTYTLVGDVQLTRNEQMDTTSTALNGAQRERPR